MKRIVKDSMGEIAIDEGRLWGGTTQRSLENFKIGTEKMPGEIIYALAAIKLAAAKANLELGKLSGEKAAAIVSAAERILAGEFSGEFPLPVWQTGSGTQSNMNVNEVIASIAAQAGVALHPNDDVNKGQSSNDVFPSALHVAAVVNAEKRLIPALFSGIEVLEALMQKNADVVKLGRTHLQDAVPITLGQEFSGWAAMLRVDAEMLRQTLVPLRALALGGTAVGTGLNAHPRMGEATAAYLSARLGTSFTAAENKFAALSSRNALVFFHGALKALAADLFKIACDVRLLSSGPRGGIGELRIPAGEPGSSIMPGKVNPTQCEALCMVCAEVFGNDATVGFAASQGHLQLNTFLPLLGYKSLESLRLLADGVVSFTDRCLAGITPNHAAIDRHLRSSLMLVTALTPVLGYDRAAAVAKTAEREGLTLKEAALSMGELTAEQFDAAVRPENMTHPEAE